MNSLVERKYIDKIIANKDLLIGELTAEFGEQYRDLLEKRFDQIKFVFFVSLEDLKKYVENKYNYLAAKKIAGFLRENKIISDVVIEEKYCGYIIRPKSDVDLFKIFFDDKEFLMYDVNGTDFEMCGIFSFDKDVDYKLLKTFARNEGLTPEEFIKRNRCKFLRDIGKYSIDYTDDMIINDPNYPSVCKYYEELMAKYNRILAEVKDTVKKDLDTYNKLKDIQKRLEVYNYKKMLEELLPILSRHDREKVLSGNYELDDIEFLEFFFYSHQNLNEKSLIERSSPREINDALCSYYGRYFIRNIYNEIRQARINAALRYNKNILNAFTFEFNGTLSKMDINLDMDISMCHNHMYSITLQNNGVEKARLILFSPFMSDDDKLDIYLRHELRHSLTSSVRKEDGYDIVKVGNSEYYYHDNKYVKATNAFYNELFTQQKALENTRASYKKGVYILSPEGSKFPKGITSNYDLYLNEFNKVYQLLPDSVLASQIEEDNSNLYSFIPAMVLEKIEEFLQNHIPQDILDALKQESQDTKMHI